MINVKFNPPEPVALMPLTMAFQPCAETKRGFGAAIIRHQHSLDVYQMNVKNLKPSSSTGLLFPRGAYGLTGSRSPAEARTATHEFRIRLFDVMGIRTDFNRFIITNMVCSTSLGFSVDLARMHAEHPNNSAYEPLLFPGLFYTVKQVYTDRLMLHQRVSGSIETVQRRLCLNQEDLLQLQALTGTSGEQQHQQPQPAASSTVDLTPAEAKALEMEASLKRLQSRLENFIPSSKLLMILVFRHGNIVGLGVNDRTLDSEAFAEVAKIALRFRIDEPANAPRAGRGSRTRRAASGRGNNDEDGEDLATRAPGAAKRKPEAQQRLAEKTRAIDEIHNQSKARQRQPRSISDQAQIEMRQATETIADPELRRAKIREILDRDKKVKRRRKAREEDELIEALAEDDAVAAADADELLQLVDPAVPANTTAVEGEDLDRLLEQELDGEGELAASITNGVAAHSGPLTGAQLVDMLLSRVKK